MADSRRVGAVFESEVVAFLQDRGLPVERSRGLEGARDVGDVLGLDRWVLDCKDHGVLKLAAWLRQVAKERSNASKPFGAAVVRKRGGSVAESYVVLSLEDFVRLEKYLGSF